jgi:uncharacterized protein (TIGR02145 family)
MDRIIRTGVMISVGFVFLCFASCRKEVYPPAVGKPLISDITTYGATIKARIIWDGESDITECGFCWNTTGKPRIDSYHKEAEMAEGNFSIKLDTLTDGIKYFIRSYARNRKEISYSLENSFTTKAITVPGVNTGYPRELTHNSVIASGSVTSDNSYNTIAKGICWSTFKNPTINDSTIVNENHYPSNFWEYITELTPATVYYIRAFATNEAGTSYGQNRVIKTFDGYTTDYEGHIYCTVRLGKQEWMNRNLETSYFSNGDKIGTTGIPTQNTEQEDKPVYQWAFIYNDYPDYLDDYGRLYTWYTATDSRKICPAGWHLPSIDEWNELLVHLGGDELTSANFRGSINSNWESQLSTGATEGSFHAQLAGLRTVTGQFQYGSYYGTYWWSATEATSANSYTVFCRSSDIEKVIQTDNNKKNGFSVRCVKD